MRTYAQSKQNKANLMATIANELKAYDENMKTAEAELIAIGEANKDAFTEGNLDLEHGYLHIAEKAVVVQGRKFSWPDFLEQKADLVNLSFKTGELKKAFLDKEQRKELKALYVQIDTVQEMQVIAAKS